MLHFEPLRPLTLVKPNHDGDFFLTSAKDCGASHRAGNNALVLLPGTQNVASPLITHFNVNLIYYFVVVFLCLC